AVILCTSGTAAVHFHGADVEADLSCVPLIVVTADRPPELRDVGAPQTIDQAKLYGASVRWFHDPGVAHADASASWSSLAARAVHRTRGSQPGPVHLNLPFREPLLGRPITLAEDLEARWSTEENVRISESTVDRFIGIAEGRRGVVIAGRGSSGAVLEVARSLGWPVLSDARGPQGEVVIRHFDSLLRDQRFAGDYRPDVVLRVGETPASKVLGQWVSASGARQIHLTEDDRWFDADHRLYGRIRGRADDLLESLSRRSVAAVPAAWSRAWAEADEIAGRVIAGEISTAELSGPVVARRFASGLPAGSELVVSSSMPVRDLEWFGGHVPHLRVHSNRGANGIDGVLATAIGVAVGSGRTTGVLIGDVAFLHDSSSLAGLANRPIDLRIMVVDNDGGGIFHFLPQAASLDPATFEKLYGTPHGTDLAMLARSHGLRAEPVVDGHGVETFAREAGPSVAVARTDRAADVELHQRLHSLVSGALHL
ncbi:MAG: 2-succinyl-5-enolpyruvyl-6-hydroxy-3-cyclohexene-1-carboxylic-acid synthase, partial [Actinomycetota bacterium]